MNILAEIDWTPETQDDIKAAFSAFDKGEEGMLNLEEMRHVLSRIGDVLTPEETANFIGMVDNFGDEHARMADMVQLMMPASQSAIDKQLQ